jgi:glycosyltransferase involved in cell wall biosynthesis
MPGPPTLSVVLANYNHGSLLRRSLPALFAQTRPADEFILLDDASTDDSRAVLAEFAHGRAHVTVVHHETNCGVIPTYREGLRRARGDYIYFAAADDVALPDLFSRLMAAAAAHLGAGLCLADFFLFRSEGGKITRCHVCLAESAAFLDGRGFGRLLLSGARFYYPPCAAIVRRDALLGLEAYDPRAGWFTDWWTNLQIGLRSGVCLVPEALAGFQVSPDSFSGGGTKKAPDIGELWSLVVTSKTGEAEIFWLCLLAVLPADVRRLLWREVLRRPKCWSWALRYGWSLVVLPALRPWLWPAFQAASRLGPVTLFPAALRWFGAAVARDVQMARGVTVDRPWKLRIDEGAVLESGVKIVARATVHIGAQAVLARGVEINSSLRAPDAAETDAVIAGARACVGENARVYAGAAIAAGAVIPPQAVIRAADSPEAARQILESILRGPKAPVA